MNSFIKYIPNSLNDHKAFVEHMLSIIDTKLQFVKHQTNALISSHTTTLAIETDDSDSPQYLLIPPERITSSEREKIFVLIERYSKTTNLLLLLRTKLNKYNVSVIYDLLNNDQYLNYEHKALENILNQHRI